MSTDTDLLGKGLEVYAAPLVVQSTNCKPCLEKLIAKGADLSLGLANNTNLIHTYGIFGMTAAQRNEAFAKGKQIMEETYGSKTPDAYGSFNASENVATEEMLKILLKAGLDINKLDVNERTPLHGSLAGGYGNKIEVMEALIKNGADITLEDPMNGKMFTLVVKTGSTKLVDHFLEKGADINEDSKIFDFVLNLCSFVF